MLLPDYIAVVLRTLGFIGVLQAAGAVIFLAVFRSEHSEVLNTVSTLARRMAIVSLVLLVGTLAVEPARMAGEMAGIVDVSLISMVAASSLFLSMSVRVAGLILIAVTPRARTPRERLVSLLGATLVAGSFALTGHTSIHPLRWLLAPLLVVHLFVLAFWFGSLIPLWLVCRREAPRQAARFVTRFSVMAVWLVPAILVAGIAMAFAIVPGWNVLREPYGLLLSSKVIGFSALMVLAAANKWRFGSRLEQGDERAASNLRRIIVLEAILIGAVLAATATMTTFFSPE